MFAKPNQVLVIYIEPIDKILPLRVKSIVNEGYEDFEYGLLPVRAGETATKFDGTSVSIPEDGVLPADSYTEPVKFSTALENVPEPEDMWYLTEDDKERLYHVYMEVAPEIVMIEQIVPDGVSQRRFSNSRTLIGVKDKMGFSRGKLEFLSIPSLRQSFVFGNDTNLDVYVSVNFSYAEYEVEPILDLELVRRIRDEEVDVYWFPLKISTYDPLIKESLEKIYGTDGFSLKSEEFEREKESILEKIKERWKK